MSRGQQFPNANEPIAQGDGKITRPWFSVLNSLWSKASGGTVTAVTASAPIASSGGTAPDISLNTSGVSAGSYTNANITVTATGLVSAAANGSAGSGTVTTTGSPVSGNLTKFSGATSITNGDLSGDVTTTGTLATTLANSGASAGTYGNSTNVAQVTVDAKGRVTAVTSVAIGGGGGGGVGGLQGPLESHTAAVSSALNFTSWYNASYSTYLIEIENLVTSAADRPQIQVSTDGGATYVTTGVYSMEGYYSQFAGGTGQGDQGQTARAGMELRPFATTQDANGSWNASIRMMNPAGANYKIFMGQVTYLLSVNQLSTAQWVGMYPSTTAVNAFRINMVGGGTLTSGTVRVYGLAT